MDPTQTDQSVYRSLDDSKSEVRVIRLQQGAGGDEIKCTLETVSLDDQPLFHALSYVWGSGTGGHINVDGHVIPITSSLALALEHLRSHHYDSLKLHCLPLWIDAVCINQAAHVERGKQVRLMSRIYRQASRVLLWIGEGDEFSDHAFDRMNDATFRASCKELKTTSRTPTSHELRVRVIISRNLEKRRYWSRVWILQEVVLASQDPVMLCGPRRMLWSWYTQCRDALPYDKWSYPGLASEWDTFDENVPVHQDFDGHFFSPLTHKVLRDSYRKSGSITLGYALFASVQLNTTDPRDYVYGLLGLVKDDERLMVDIDYEKAPEQVFREIMAALWTSNTSELISDLFHRLISWVGVSERLEVPSWAPDLSRPTKAKPEYTFSLVNINRSWRPETRPKVQVQGNVLTISATKFDSIADTVELNFDHGWSDTFHRGKGPGEVDLEPLRLMEAMAQNGFKIPIPASSRLAPFSALRDKMPIWSALTAWEGNEVSYGGGSENDEWLRGVVRDKQKLWEILMCRQEIPEVWKTTCPPDLQGNLPALETAILSPLLRAIGDKVDEKRVFISRSGFLGVGTKHVKAGDIITFIAGMECMYMLRPFSDGYRIVGFAYVSGLMDWDDLDEAMKAGTLQDEELKIY